MAFKIASGYVSVEIRYDQRRLRKAAEKAGRDTGDAFSSAFSKRVERTLGRGRLFKDLGSKSGKDFATSFGTRFQRDFKDSLGTKKLEREVQKTGGSLGRSLSKGMRSGALKGMRSLGKDAASSFSRGFDENIRTRSVSLVSPSSFREQGRRGGRVFVEGFGQSVERESSSAPFRRFGERIRGILSREGGRSGKSFISRFSRDMINGARESSDTFGRLMRKSMDLTVGGLLVILGGLAVAAPVIGAAMAAGITLAFGAGIVGLGVLAAAQSEKVKSAFSRMSSNIVSSMKSMARPLEGTLVSLAGQIEKTFNKLSPSLKRAFENSAPTITRFNEAFLGAFGEWGPVIDSASDAFNGLLDALSPMLRESIGELGDKLKSLFDTVAANPEPFANIIDNIVDFASWVVGVTDKLASFYVRINQSEEWENFKGNMSPVVDGLKDIGEMVAPIAEQAIKDFLGAFGDSDDIEDTEEAVSNLVEAVSGAVEVFNKADSGFRKFTKGWNEHLEKNEERGDKFFSKVKLGYDATVTGVSTMLRIMGRRLSKGWDAIKTTASEKWSNFRTNIKTRFSGAANDVQTRAKNLRTNLSNRWDEIKKSATTKWSNIKTNIQTRFGGVVSGVRSRAKDLGKNLSSRWETIKKTASSKWSTIRSNVTSRVSSMASGVRSRAKDLGKNLSSRWETIKKTASSKWSTIRSNVTSRVSSMASGVRSRAKDLGKNLSSRWETIKKTASSKWSTIRSNVTSRVSSMASGVRNRAKDLGKNLSSRWETIKKTASTKWSTIKTNVKNRFGTMASDVQKRAKGFGSNLSSRWESMKKTASTKWSSIKSNVKNRFGTMASDVQKRAKGFGSNIASRWSDIRKNTGSRWNDIKNSVVDKTREFKDKALRAAGDFRKGFVSAFDRTHRAFSRVWNKIKRVAAVPVNFMIDKVYNNGIRILWSKIADHVPGLGYLKAAPMVKFATGGIMPGYTPGRDVHTVPGPNGRVGLSGGEAIMRPEWTRAVGAENVHRMNAIARSGGVSGVRNALGFSKGGVASRESLTGRRSIEKRGGDPVEGFSIGGIVAGALNKAKDFASKILGNITGWATKPFTSAFNLLKGKDAGGTDKKIFPGVPYHAGQTIWEKMKDLFQSEDDSHNSSGSNWTGAKGNLSKAVKWARSQHGKPYQWGGNGNPSWDCSGYLSAIESVIRGQKPHRRWSTHAFGKRGPSGWQKDLDSPFMIGITHRGVGHTAGTLMGNKVESAGGGKGVRFNGGALGHDSSKFQSVYGLHNAIPLAKRLKTGSGRWRTVVEAVLKELGLPLSHASNVLKAIQKESGGNARAKNNWDSNARAGTPSMGLLQTIKPTFDAYAGKYKKLGPYNPKANIYAAIRYAQARYGAGWSARMARPGGYALGGVVGGTPLGRGSHDVGGLLPDRHVAYNRSGETEVVHTLDQLKAIVAAAEKGGDTFNGDIILQIHPKDIDQIKNLVSLFDRIRQAGRANGANVKFDIRGT